MIQELINRYKRMRTERFLRQTYQYQYAFVGMGQHSLTNLYPVLHYLGVPLKYICVMSERKAKLIEQKYPSIKATTSLDEILKDESVKGVFVSASPAMVGLQKRYAPAVQLLKQRLRKEHLINYDLHYLTGAYPEGYALLDLYIHPLDLVCHLFGPPEILAYLQVTNDSYILMLQHPHIVGTLELSTAYTWTTAEEALKVCSHSGVYTLSQMEELTFSPTYSSIFGIPMEKLRPRHETNEVRYQRNNFTPVLENNQVYTQGYYSEIEAFISQVEKRKAEVTTGLMSVRSTYELLQALQSTRKHTFGQNNDISSSKH